MEGSGDRLCKEGMKNTTKTSIVNYEILVSLSHAYFEEEIFGERERPKTSIVSLEELLGLLNILQGPPFGHIILNSIVSMSYHVMTYKRHEISGESK